MKKTLKNVMKTVSIVLIFTVMFLFAGIPTSVGAEVIDAIDEENICTKYSYGGIPDDADVLEDTCFLLQEFRFIHMICQTVMI